MRALAQRSAEAAREIKGLLSASSTEVDHGVKLVGETGQSLERIVGKIIEINSVVADMATSAQEQATALQQVNTAVNEMDHVTQQNAAMAEQANAASRSLSQESDRLAEQIGQFQVGGTLAPERLRSELKSRPARLRKANGQADLKRCERLSLLFARAPSSGPRECRDQQRQRPQMTKRMIGASSRRETLPTFEAHFKKDLHMATSDAPINTRAIELITFRIGAQEFCIDVTSIREIRSWTTVTPIPHAPPFVLGVVNLRGIVLPIIDLSARLGFAPADPTPRHAIMVAELHHQVVGLLVDGVSDIITVKSSDFQAPPDVASDIAKSFISGITSLSSG